MRPTKHHEAETSERALLALMPRLTRRARRLTGDAAQAEDLAQEAALRLWRRMQEGAAIEDLQSYAMITLRNLAQQGWRQRGLEEEIEEDMASIAPQAPARIACAEVMAQMTQLPEAQTALLKAVALQEQSPQALAKRAGLPRGTIHSRLARARARLRAELQMDADTSVSDMLDVL